MTKHKFDIYQAVTDRIVAQLEAGVNPWRKPWTVGAGQHQNLISRKPYRGINAVITMMSGYASPYWVTFNQAKQLGGTVRRGEKGTQIVYWNFVDKADKDNPDETRRIPFIKYFTVFNVSQCDGLTVPAVEAVTTSLDDRAEAAITAWTGKPRINHGFDHAAYVPLADEVHMPARVAFHSTEEYYGTLFHELVHSTGAAGRLDRFKPNEGQFVFGSTSYSQEELTAEIGSAFVAARIGLTLNEQNSAAYLRGWLQKLKSDKKFIFIAAREAQKAADHILGTPVQENGDDAAVDITAAA